ncbi:MAG: large-conductance mechanosensitive channel protein MscL [Streptococcaceae bacterium]|nr:large-conductance mechanosensitive channel protein MscL [Streptococcaceae bacterium]MCL2680927.1 large-conductance mechanosensitive channel protein MscL [Streptococcaceae bacterium]
MLKEFKEFILRGNVLDLAIAVIIGTAFTAIIVSLVTNLINPLVGIFLPGGALTKLNFTIGSAKFAYGTFLNDVISFIIIALVIFLLVKGINKLFPKKNGENTVVINEELETLREIRDLLKENK